MSDIASAMFLGEIWMGLIVLALFMLGGAFIWRLTRSSVRKSEMIDAYFTSKLKKHAEKFSIDLNTEMQETRNYGFWETASKNRKEAKQKRLRYSNVAGTDLLFEALDEKEETVKKK